MMKKHTFVHYFLLMLIVGTNGMLASCGQTISQPTELELLSAIENAFVSVAARSTPAIVGVSAYLGPRRSSQGSGFIFRKEGYILTNEHVLMGSQRITVQRRDGSELDAKIVGTDLNTDIAVLKIAAKEELPVLRLADSDKVRVGQFAIAIGNPFQLAYTVTTGIVSGKGRTLLYDRGGIIRYEDFIQTDAWINTGNSGGPLLNIHGEVIGINALIRRTEPKSDNTDVPIAVRAGAGFAIPSNLVQKVGNQLIANGRVIRGFLGINMADMPEGIYVSRVTRNTPAALGGLRRGDVIIKYNGKKVQNSNEFKMLIADSQVGEASKITLLRNGVERILTVTIAEMPPQFTGRAVENNSVAWKMLGLAVRKMEKGDFERYTYLSEQDNGVIVVAVKLNSPGFNARIPRGALIMAVNGKPIPDAQAFDAFLQARRKASSLVLQVKSSHGTETLTVPLVPN